jgi:hypothetical protein
MMMPHAMVVRSRVKTSAHAAFSATQPPAMIASISSANPITETSMTLPGRR